MDTRRLLPKDSLEDGPSPAAPLLLPADALLSDAKATLEDLGELVKEALVDIQPEGSKGGPPSEAETKLSIAVRAALALLGAGFVFLSMLPSVLVFLLLSHPSGVCNPFTYVFLAATVAAPLAGVGTVALALCTPLPLTPQGMPRRPGYWRDFILLVLKPVIWDAAALLAALACWCLVSLALYCIGI